MNSKSTPLQLGLIAGIIGIIFSVIQTLFFADKIGTESFGIVQVLQIISFAIMLYFMFKAANDMKKENGGFLPFKAALKSSYLVAVVASVIAFLFSLLSRYVLFSDVWDQIYERSIDKAIAKMEAQGQSEEMIEASMGMIEKFMDMGIWFSLPMMLIVFFIIALIVAAIVKKNPTA